VGGVGGGGIFRGGGCLLLMIREMEADHWHRLRFEGWGQT
jgi:hypothetical protein